MTDRTLYVGTVGEGLWRSKDLGESYERLSNGLFIEADVRAIAVHPTDSQTLYAGTNCGIYKSKDAGQSWRLLNAGFGSGWPRSTDQEVWSLAIVPDRPDVVFAGVCPAAIYRSIDAGETWRLLDAGITPECGPIRFSRVTCLAVEPGAAAAIWAGVEIDGIRVSNDLGESWENRSEGLSSLDIHSLLIRGGDTELIASTNNDLNGSCDSGKSWSPRNISSVFDWRYCRGSAHLKGEVDVILVGNGNGPPGDRGAIQKSIDGGKTWSRCELPYPPNSTVWGFSVTSEAPGLVAAYTVSGQIFVSSDYGSAWSKAGREFGEIRSLAIV